MQQKRRERNQRSLLFYTPPSSPRENNALPSPKHRFSPKKTLFFKQAHTSTIQPSHFQRYKKKTTNAKSLINLNLTNKTTQKEFLALGKKIKSGETSPA
ncbi:MAG TPA: hypothetical protein H9807_10090 [Candidatus Bacteroides merdavium]|uniref:Uncharacterized protein n=1 Tax=Candidatus Bacteroides merdavium TaxID=2838472 RepID=A0A9D2GZU5_9BACE|nr:hypothetical protein [Candidatus Bacteroides merdavium]